MVFKVAFNIIQWTDNRNYSIIPIGSVKISVNSVEILLLLLLIFDSILDECSTNFCQTKSCTNEIFSPLINRCLINPCEVNQQCTNIYPDNYLCLCSNCSTDSAANRYTAGFHLNSYLKHLPLKPMDSTGRFYFEIWFLTESSSGSILYSEHMNTKKGYFKLYLDRKMLLFNIVIGSKTISLR